MEGAILVDLQFNVDNDPYKTSITNLSEHLANYPERRNIIIPDLEIERPLLPEQKSGQPDRWMCITLSTLDPKNDNLMCTTTLAVRGDNVWFAGFKNQYNVWYEFGKEPDKNRPCRGSPSFLKNKEKSKLKNKKGQAPNPNSPSTEQEKDTHILTGSTFLGFDGTYPELIGSVWVGRKLGQISARRAVLELAKYNGVAKRTFKLCLAQLIVIICESARMFSHRDLVGLCWGLDPEPCLTKEDHNNQIEYLTNWGKMSRAIMGLAGYTKDLSRIGITGHHDACNVVHLVLNSPKGMPVAENASGGGEDPDNSDDHPMPDADGASSGDSSPPGGGNGQSSGQGGGGDGQSSGQGRGGDGQSSQTRDGNWNSKLQQHVDCGQSLVEVFTLGADILFAGTITVFDGRHGQIIVWNDEVDGSKGNFELAGPYRGISADGRVALKIMRTANGGAKEDVSIWDPYADAEHQYDKIITKNIPGGLELTYAVMSSAVEASVQVDFFLFENIDFYGEITAHIQLAKGEEATVVLLSSGDDGKVELVTSPTGWRIPLTRSVVAWPVLSRMNINVNCIHPVTTPNHEGTKSNASATTTLNFIFDPNTPRVCFQTLDGIGKVRVSVDDTRQYRDEPNNSLPRSLMNEVNKSNTEMYVRKGLLDVHPGQLTFTIEPNKIMSCLLHLNNNSYDDHIAFRFHRSKGIFMFSGILPPDSTSTYLVSLKGQLPWNMHVFPFILESCVVPDEEEVEEDEEVEEEEEAMDEEEEEEDDKEEGDQYVDNIFMQRKDGIVKVPLSATVCGPADETTTISEGNDTLKGMAVQLAGMLSAEGKKGRIAWEILHGKVAEVATSIADPAMSVQALLGILFQEMGSPDLGYPEAQLLVGKVAMLVHGEVSAQNADASKAISLLKNMILLVADQLSMIPLRNSFHVDMIDGDANFSQQNVDGIVKGSIELSATNAPYSVVSIVGAHSSGKSYLLNQLFGTKFPMMDYTIGRSQTTQGILITRCIDPSLLVLDIEGFDGRERGEFQDKAFEKKAALFALTVSDLMMVNISIFDIGRQDGGSMGLFKTIFQERTKLDAGLTQMLVIIRNCNEEARLSLPVLRKDVIENLEKVWKIVNPEASFKEYIEINVVGLPDKESEDFQKEVTKLRKHFSSSSTISAKVPAQSFSISSKMLWDQINQNKRLHLPSHMVLIATIFCQQAAEACIEQFDDELLKSEESPQCFKETSDAILASIIAQYNQGTEMYDAGVRDKERQKMVDNINKIFAQHSRELIKKIQQNTSEQFKEYVRNLENMEDQDGLVVYDENIVEPSAEEFKKLCEGLKVFDPDYFHEICEYLRKQLTSYTVLHILKVNEDRARKNVELALQRAEQNVQELVLRLDQMAQERQDWEEEIRREMELREEERNREQEEIKRAIENVERREKMLEEEKAKMAAEEAARKEKEHEKDLDRREKRLEEVKDKMAAEEAARKDRAVQKDLENQKEQIRILQLELARQVQQQNTGSPWRPFG